jgi:hypothetical protein
MYLELSGSLKEHRVIQGAIGQVHGDIITGPGFKGVLTHLMQLIVDTVICFPESGVLAKTPAGAKKQEYDSDNK